jgi:DNA polymerase III epsilon subunit-like protein
MTKLFCVDFETTGLESKSTIIEIASVELNEKHETWFEMLVNPETSIPSQIQALTGITDSMVKFAATEKTALELFIAFLQKNQTDVEDEITLICHNALFDKRVLESACQRHGIPLPTIKWVCTLKMSRAFPRWRKKSCTLQNCVKRIGGSFRFHRAMGDVRACMELYKYLNAKNEEKGPLLETIKENEFHSILSPPLQSQSIPMASDEQECVPCIAAAMCGNYYMDPLAMTKTSGLCDSCSDALDYHYKYGCTTQWISQISCIEKLVQSNAALTLLALSKNNNSSRVLKRKRESS